MDTEDRRGKIFDIRRFSTHDGDGIRTTVFFKGCPLQCAWCHNPEGISLRRRPVYFAKKCIHCGMCYKTARHGGVRLDSDHTLQLDVLQPENWDRIMEVCPSGALVWDAREVEFEELLQEVLRDEPFFRHGGGVTLSGGEPLLQPEFAAKLLEHLQQRGIHTAIETALYVPAYALLRVQPYLNQIFADLKLFDSEQHKKYTGVNNGRIKQNLRMLLESAHRKCVTVRTPMIPGITATEENIVSISRFISGIYRDVSYELLNYNPLAAAKYHLVDRTYCFEENPPRFTEEEMQHFASLARENGVLNVQIDR